MLPLHPSAVNAIAPETIIGASDSLGRGEIRRVLLAEYGPD
jgi:hypothetical protein